MRLLVLLTAFVSVGCSSQSNSIITGQLDEQLRFAPLQRSDYTVLGDAHSRECATSVALWPIPLWFISSRSGTSMFGVPPWARASNEAYYQAVESAPDADMILFSRSKIETRDYLWFREDCVTIKGKAVAIRNGGAIVEQPAKVVTPSNPASDEQKPSAP